MKKMALLLAFLFVLLAASHSPPVPFEDNKSGLFGYADSRTGEMAIPPRFMIAEPFNQWGCAYAAGKEGWSYINTRGKELVRPFLFDNGPDAFQEGLARFVREGKMGFYNQQGKIAIPAVFDFCEPFANGQAAVCQGCYKEYMGEHYTVRGGKWGCIDPQGHLLHPLSETIPDCHPGR